MGLEPDGGEEGVLGGVNQAAPGPVIGWAWGQAGFLAATCPAACTTTGFLLMRIESPARSGPACFVAAWRTLASICSAAPGPVPYVAPIDGALSGMASASSCRSGSWTIVPGAGPFWPAWSGPLLFPVFVPAGAAGPWMVTVSTRPTRLGGQSWSGPGVPR